MTEKLPVDENCPSVNRHHSLNACREDGCRCPGPGYDRWMAYRQRRQDRRPQERAQGREADRLRRAGIQLQVPSADAYRATEAGRALRSRTDLACRDYDPEWFMLESTDERVTGVQRQIERAREVCLSCPAMLQCAEDALEHYDPWSILGGMSPREREDIRAARGLTAPRVRKAPATSTSTSTSSPSPEALRKRRSRARRAQPQPPAPIAGADPAVVHAFYAGRLLWIRTTEADRVLLFSVLREKGWAMNTVAKHLNVSHQKVAEYWQVAA
jgi:WhiB family redox-sensing transcriptional regulator